MVGTSKDGAKEIIKVLTLPSSPFLGVSEESERRLLVRQCYEELAEIILAHFRQDGRVFVLKRQP